MFSTVSGQELLELMGHEGKVGSNFRFDEMIVCVFPR